WLIYRQTFTRQFLVGMGVAIAGAIIIGIEDLQLADGFVGDEAALAASMLSAVSILSIERLRIQFSTAYIMMWTSLIGSLFLAVLLWCLHDTFFPSTSEAWAAVIALALLSQALGQGLLTYSLKQFSASLVAVSMLSIPVIAAFLAVILLAERLSLLNWIAFGIVLGGIYLAVSSKFSEDTNFPEDLKNVAD
ncbi:MAG: DMT family transporter, partial [Okeania sp. SIO2H7]|nr:DMT family transporter [Okeania sp. SIO2H7]